MKKIGILGGTFDPIHNGHLMMGKAALEEAGLDEIWFMPTGTPAYKAGSRRVSDKEHRVRMTELAIQNMEHCVCSRMETEREGNTYTADTLTALKQMYPDCELYYIVGADSLDYMDRWYHPERIFPCAVILVVMRSTQSPEEMRRKAEELSARFHGDIRLLGHKQVDISSTQLRRMAAAREDMSGLLPDAVRQYIAEHRLYMDQPTPDGGIS